MMNRVVVMLCLALSAGVAVGAQEKKAAPKTMVQDVTITADSVYTGTMELAIDAGKVTGTMLITSPTEITGKVAGTSKGGELALDFPFHMTENACDGTVKMTIALPATPGPSKGTMEAVGCGRDESNKVTGTVEMKPHEGAAPAANGRRRRHARQ
jgi:hypothetical protein